MALASGEWTKGNSWKTRGDKARDMVSAASVVTTAAGDSGAFSAEGRAVVYICSLDDYKPEDDQEAWKGNGPSPSELLYRWWIFYFNAHH